MSVASKTTTKIFIAACLTYVAIFAILPTWASTTPGSISLVPVPTTFSSQESNQDISVLWTKLKERFSGIATEVRTLINTTTNSNSDGTGLRIIDLNQGKDMQTTMMRQNFFVDIENDPYQMYITRLAAYGVLAPSEKFYPQNYFRSDDFISLFIKIYNKKFNQSVGPQDILVTAPDGLMTKGMLQQLLYAFNDRLPSLTIEGNPYDRLMRSEGSYYLVRVFDIPVLVYDTITSSVMGNAFADIDKHPLASAINILASLNILNTQTTTFYPDNYVRHYDFVIMLVNAFLTSKNLVLSALDGYSQFADVSSSTSYLPQLTYAADRGLIDDIITSKNGQLYFNPNSFINKYEVYQILTKTLNIQFVYDIQTANQQKISRAELADLLVKSFQFTPKTLSEPVLSSGNSLNTNEISILTTLKALLSML